MLLFLSVICCVSAASDFSQSIVIGHTNASTSKSVAVLASSILKAAVGNITVELKSFASTELLTAALADDENVNAALDVLISSGDKNEWSARVLDVGPTGFSYRPGWFISSELAYRNPGLLCWEFLRNTSVIQSLLSPNSELAPLLVSDFHSTAANHSSVFIQKNSLKLELMHRLSAPINASAFFLLTSPDAELVNPSQEFLRLALPTCLTPDDIACELLPQTPIKLLNLNYVNSNASSSQLIANFLSKMTLTEPMMNEYFGMNGTTWAEKSSNWVAKYTSVWKNWVSISSVCPDGQTLRGLQCEWCEENYYFADGVCLQCPIHGTCPGKDIQPFAQEGFWRSPLETPVHFYPCTPRHACPGLQDEICAHGKEGVLCAECSPHHLHLMGHCTSCSVFSKQFRSTTPVFAVLVVALWILIHHMTAGVLDAFEISLLFLQICQIIGSYHVGWPSGIGDMFSYLSFVVFETDLVSPACYATDRWPFFNRFFLQNILPLAFFFALFIKGTVSVYLRRRKDSSEIDGAFWESVRSEVAMSIETFLNISYPLLVSTALNVFNCTTVEGVEVLVAQPSLQCWHGDHNILVAFAVVSLLLFTIGVPAFFSFILYRAYTKRLFDDPSFRRVHGWLYMRFEDEFFFWELTFLLRKFLFVAVAVFVQHGEVQLVCSVIIILFFVMLHMSCMPFDDDKLDMLESVYLILLAMFTIGGLMFEATDQDIDLVETRNAWIVAMWCFLGFSAFVVVGAAAYNIVHYARDQKVRRALSKRASEAMAVRNSKKGKPPISEDRVQLCVNYLCDCMAPDPVRAWYESNPSVANIASMFLVASAIAARNKNMELSKAELDYQNELTNFYRNLFVSVPSVMDFVLSAPPSDVLKAAQVLAQLAQHYAGSTAIENEDEDLDCVSPEHDHGEHGHEHIHHSHGVSDIAELSHVLSQNRYFIHLDEAQVGTLAASMRLVTGEKGDYIIKQGDVGEHFYVLMSGSCDIVICKGDSSQETVVASIGSGGSFGELALMYNSPRAASVVCTSSCRLWALHRDSFEKHLRKFSAGRADLSGHLNGETGYMVLQFAVDSNLSCRLKPGQKVVGCCLCTSVADPKPFLDCELHHDHTGAQACEAQMREHFMQLRGIFHAMLKATKKPQRAIPPRGTELSRLASISIDRVGLAGQSGKAFRSPSIISLELPPSSPDSEPMPHLIPKSRTAPRVATRARVMPTAVFSELQEQPSPSTLTPDDAFPQPLKPLPFVQTTDLGTFSRPSSDDAASTASTQGTKLIAPVARRLPRVVAGTANGRLPNQIQPLTPDRPSGAVHSPQLESLGASPLPSRGGSPNFPPFAHSAAFV